MSVVTPKTNLYTTKIAVRQSVFYQTTYTVLYFMEVIREINFPYKDVIQFRLS